MPSVTRKPQAKRQERREQIERRLLDATERLMRDGASFTELCVDRLSTEAGMSRASFYIYFEDKGHLLRRLAGQVFADLAESAERWWSVAWRHDPDDVRAGMAAIIASYRRHQPVLVALNEMAAYDSLVGATYQQSADCYHRAIGPCHRRWPGRWLNPPRAPGADHGKCAHLDGRADLSTEPAEQPAHIRCRARHHADRNRLGCFVSEA